MRLDTLLPRPLSPETDAESPSVLSCLLTGIHLDRKRARALGWRGVRPSNQLYAAWTCRLVDSPHVYGLVFRNEYADESFLYGTFAVHVFPRATDGVLDMFPLRALATALDGDYEEKIRNLSRHAEELAPFCMGELQMVTALDGTGLSLTLAAPARYRHISEKGIAAPTMPTATACAGQPCSHAGWIVPPGGVECDVPAFRLLLRLFTTLTATAVALFEEESRLSLYMNPHKRSGATADPSGATDLTLHATMGTAPPTPSPTATSAGNCPVKFPSMSARGKVLAHLPARWRSELTAHGVNLPVMHILTGFLGAGKTTFLRRWLDYLNGREQFAAVIQNEFGHIGLDASLTRGETHVEALNEGCVCCSLADSLRPGLLRLLQAAPAEQVILETTGLANPVNVLESLKELDDIVRPGLELNEKIQVFPLDVMFSWDSIK
ncbi:MAG: GTP-binding protein, partial [Desulfovibrio sp.]|nr:GTP-binding protein [Desulfovibrio sp.]